MTSPGSEYVSNTGNVTLGAQTSSNGSINVTNAGVLTVGSASVLTGITVPGLTGGITTVAPGVSVTGVTANGSGDVNLTATGATGDIVTTQAVNSGTGNIVMTAARNVTDTATGSVTTGGSGTIGVSAQTGSITMADGSSYTTAGGNITASAANNIALAQATTGSNTAGTVTLTATNGAISNNRTAGANNVTAGTLNATAATGIGSGTLDSATALTTNIETLGTTVTGAGDAVIDNTNAALLTLGNGTLTNSAANGSVRVATAGAVTTGNIVSASNTVQLITGDSGGTLANNVGTVTLANNVTANTLDIDSGGLVQQTGGTLSASTTLVDATRYTSGSDATLTNGTGTLTENGSSVTGNYTIATAGTLNQTGNTTGGGNLTESGFTGGTVSGTVTTGGNYSGVNTFSGSGSVTAGGSNTSINANAATTGVVMATGPGPNFDLSSANLGNSTDITVDLRGQSATVTGNTPAILLNGASGGSNSLGTVTVKTAKPVAVAVTQQDYNLVQSSAIDIGTHTLTVNAVAGGASSASLQASPGTIQVPGTQTGINYNAANNTLNGGLGSRIVLNNAGNTIGGLSIANAESANVATTGNLALGNVTLNNGLSASSSSGAITQTAGTSVAGRTLELSAVNGIGTSAAAIGFNTAAAVSAGATPVLATTDGAGNTFVETTGQVHLGGGVYNVTDTSTATSSTLTTAANSTTGGNLSVVAAGPVTTGQTVSTGGNGNINIDTTAGSVTLSNTVTAGGSGSVRLAAATDLNVDAVVSSTSGEVNARAYNGNVTLGANVSTTGDAFVQASNAITQNAGTLTSDAAVLTAGTTVGSSTSPIETSVNTLALVSGGNATVVNDKAMTLAAQTSNNGSVNATTTNGTLTVGSVSLSPTITNNAVGASLSGVAANGAGNVSLSASGTGGNIVADNNVTSGTGTIAATTSGNVTFDNSAQMATAGTVALTAAGDIVNNTTNSVDQIQANGATLTAGGNVGSGIIDNGITGTTNASELYLNVSDLTVAAGGSATMRNEGATVLETSAAGGYFGLNGGGTITQATGATLSAGSVEFDTTRNATIGQVALQNSGDLTIAGANYAGGDYAATSQSGNVTLAGTLNVNGNVTLTSGAGGTVTASPTSIASSGAVVQNGVTTNIAGAQIPLITIDSATRTATINAQGAGANFVLTPTLVAQLKAAGVTTVTVDLDNTTTSYSVASLTGPAITVANANNAVSGGWTVRTGTPALATPTQAARDYNLTDTAGPLDLSGTSLIVNAARGTGFSAGATPSTVAAINNGANAAAGFNAAQGSNVTLTQTTLGSLDVRDAYDVAVMTPGTLNVSYVNANHDVTLLAGTANSGNLNVNGNVTAGNALIGVGGRDVNIASGATVSAVGPVTLVADETAGTNAGPGWFINNGRISSKSGEVAVYGVAGDTPAGYVPVANQVMLGNIEGYSGSVPIGNWGTNYDSTANGPLYQAGTGKLNGVQVWYKRTLVALPAVEVMPTGAAVPAVPAIPTVPANPVYREPADPLIMSAGFTMSGGCGSGQYAGGGQLGRAGSVEYDIGVPTYMNTATRQFGVVRGARPDDGRVAKFDCIDERAFESVQTGPGPIVATHFSLNEDVLFAFDRSSERDMLPGGREALDAIIADLRNTYRNLRLVSIIGHTDRIGSDAYNRELSLARAQTVRDYMVSHGLPVSPVAVAGVGNAAPVTKDCPAGKTPESIRCLQPDRRVTIDVVGEQRQTVVPPAATPHRIDATAPQFSINVASTR
ncbi:OmpA family protein [Burkholderia ambifaria]|uniref:OmpA family protein n=2 Tax=Burkholderia ambifaria TaxID=152480 RepID=UPI002FE152DD